MRGLAGIACGVCCAVVIACATDSKRSAATMPASDPHAQIADLSSKIDAERAQLELPEPGGAHAMAIAPVAPVAPQACHPAATETCTSVCTLADSICGNADKICDLARQLAGDTWAADKCTAGKATCDAARAKCCGCQP